MQLSSPRAVHHTTHKTKQDSRDRLSDSTHGFTWRSQQQHALLRSGGGRVEQSNIHLLLGVLYLRKKSNSVIQNNLADKHKTQGPLIPLRHLYNPLSPPVEPSTAVVDYPDPTSRDVATNARKAGEIRDCPWWIRSSVFVLS